MERAFGPAQCAGLSIAGAERPGWSADVRSDSMSANDTLFTLLFQNALSLQSPNIAAFSRLLSPFLEPLCIFLQTLFPLCYLRTQTNSRPYNAFMYQKLIDYPLPGIPSYSSEPFLKMPCVRPSFFPPLFVFRVHFNTPCSTVRSCLRPRLHPVHWPCSCVVLPLPRLVSCSAHLRHLLNCYVLLLVLTSPYLLAANYHQ